MTSTQAHEGNQQTQPTARGSGVRYTVIGLVVAVIGYLVAYSLLSPPSPQGGYRLADGFSVFSGFFLVALALERLLEPVRQLLGPDTSVRKDELAKASAASRTSPTPARAGQEMAQQQAAIDAERRQTSLMMWGIGTGAGFVVAALANTLFLRTIAAPGLDDPSLPPLWFDLLLTGLIVGSGTKPTHDLVSRIEKSKNAAEDKAVRGAANPG